jgi:hypothetical protein
MIAENANVIVTAKAAQNLRDTPNPSVLSANSVVAEF